MNRGDPETTNELEAKAIRICFAAMRSRSTTAANRPFLIASILVAVAAAATMASSAPLPAVEVVDEVIENIRRQKVGAHTVADFHLPEDFLRGLADRIIATSFEERFRIVVGNIAVADGSQKEVGAKGESPKPSAPMANDALRRIDHIVPEPAKLFRAKLVEQRPGLFGFRAVPQGEPWPIDPPRADAPAWLTDAAQVVGRNLAKEGLLPTLVRALQIMVPQCEVNENFESVLRSVGVPTDLLAMFEPLGEIVDGDKHHQSKITQWVIQELAAGETAKSLEDQIRSARFSFRQSLPGFRVATESGEHAISAIRLQLSRGGYWQGAGDGGNVDMTRQLVEHLPDASFIASIQRHHADEFASVSSAWPWRRTGQITLIAEDLPVAQWAQDNAKPGGVNPYSGDQNISLVPRFASRGEDGSIFIPGETYLVQGLAAAGLHVVQSPLIFQGGNLIAVHHPLSGERILLIGEAEVYRNQALGLSSAQVIDAFRSEFGVDRCEVLPAVSFHIDFDFCVRAHGKELIAFVNDARSAAATVLECAVEAMESRGLLTRSESQAAKDDLRGCRGQDFLNRVGRLILAMGGEHGHFPISAAECFRTDGQSVECGVGNLHRILLALDVLAAAVIDLETMVIDSPTRLYLEVIQRRELARQALHEKLASLGFKVIPVPGLADAARGTNYVNGIHARGVYLMPAYGGLFSRLDDAAVAAFQNALGAGPDRDAVRITPIGCAESQRRVGALHCSYSVFYTSSAPEGR